MSDCSTLQLTELTMTCSACPSQWDGKLADGRQVYARYRYGYLTVEAADDFDTFSGTPRQLLAAVRDGDGLDGVMSTDRMLQLAGLVAP